MKKKIPWFVNVILLLVLSAEGLAQSGKVSPKATNNASKASPALKTVDTAKPGTPVLKLVDGYSVIPALISTDPLKKKEDMIILKFKLLKEITRDTNIFISSVALGLVRTNPRIIDPSFKLSSTDWFETRGGKDTLNKTFYVETNAVSSLDREESLYLSLKGDKEVHQITINEGFSKTVAKIKLRPGSHTIAPFFDDNEAPQRDTVRITLDLFDKYDRNNNTVTFTIDTVGLLNKPQIVPSRLTIDSLTWTKSNGKLDTILVVETVPVKRFTSVMQGVLKTANDTNHTDVITLWFTKKGVFAPTASFWVELGTNFDLLDGAEINNFYSGIYMFVKDIAGINGRKSDKRKNVSFTGGVYEAKSTSTSISSDSGLIYRDGKSYLFDSLHKGYPYYRDIGAVSTITSIKNVGLFFSPYLRLNKVMAEDNGFHIFLSIYAELLWQKISSNIDYSKLARDTVMYMPRSNSGDTSIYNFPYKETQVSSDFRSHYYGIGIPIYIKENDYNFYLNSVFGISTQKFMLVQFPANDVNSKTYLVKKYPNGNVNTGILPGFAYPKHSVNPFYLFQFRLNEERYGLTITGEVRGFILDNSKPITSISLSKKFDVGELYHAIVKPFTPGGNKE